MFDVFEDLTDVFRVDGTGVVSVEASRVSIVQVLEHFQEEPLCSVSISRGSYKCTEPDNNAFNLCFTFKKCDGVSFWHERYNPILNGLFNVDSEIDS